MRKSPITMSTKSNSRPTLGPAIRKKISTTSNGVLRIIVT